MTDTFSQYCILETTTASPQNSVCNVAPEDRRECGYAGIGEADCLERGCCYDNSISDTIWCFSKKGDDDEWKQKLAKKNTDITDITFHHSELQMTCCQIVLLVGHIFQTLIAATNIFPNQEAGSMPGVSAAQFLLLMETLPLSLTKLPMSS